MASLIQWTEETWNPLRAHRNSSTDPEYSDKRGMEMLGVEGWHCEHVSPGCLNCYAETQNVAMFRGGTGLAYNQKSRTKVETFLHRTVLEKPLHWKKPRTIFVCSMTDIFGEWVPDSDIDQIFAIMALTPHHTYQVLTKRAKRMREYLSGAGVPKKMEVDYNAGILARAPVDAMLARNEPWPLRHVHLGVSAEDQPRWDERVLELLQTPAAVHWVSYEPALGPVDITSLGVCACDVLPGSHLDWIVVGGESGKNARRFDVQWARDMILQCKAADVPVFVKQLGSNTIVRGADLPMARMGGPDHLDNESRKWRHKKGGDITEWPADLRVREYPHATTN